MVRGGAGGSGYPGGHSCPCQRAGRGHVALPIRLPTPPTAHPSTAAPALWGPILLHGSPSLHRCFFTCSLRIPVPHPEGSVPFCSLLSVSACPHPIQAFLTVSVGHVACHPSNCLPPPKSLCPPNTLSVLSADPLPHCCHFLSVSILPLSGL